MRLHSFCYIVVLILFYSTIVTVSEAADGTVDGYVISVSKSGGKYLGGVKVIVTGGGISKSTKTNVNGFYYITGLGGGKYRVIFKKKGYKTVTKTITLVGDSDGKSLYVGMKKK